MLARHGIAVNVLAWHDGGVAGETGIWQDELSPAAGAPSQRSTRLRTAGTLLSRTLRGSAGSSPHAQRRGAFAAIAAIAAGAVAFAVSLVLEWQHITLTLQGNDVDVTRAESFHSEVAAKVGDLDLFGMVYLFGVIGLLVAAGLAMSRADLASRLRLPVAGGSLGLAAMLVAVALRVSQAGFDTKPSILDNLRYLSIDGDGNMLSASSAVNVEASVGGGLLFALAAVLLPLGAVWLASRSAPQGYAVPAPAVAQPVDLEEPEDAAEDAGDVVDANEPYRWRPRDPYDLTVTPS
jgi:hypothetical protein